MALLASVGGLVFVQHLVPKSLRKQHNDVAGFIYAVLGVAYAVLLGLMVVAVWQGWDAAKNNADQESSDLAEVFWGAHQLPQPQGRHIQELARSYGQVVVNEEWPLMREGKVSPKAWALLDEMRGNVEKLDPKTPAQQVLYDQELQRVHELYTSRRQRLLDAEDGLPAILWVVLIIGGVLVVGFTYLFGMESSTTHLLMVASLTLIIALVLFTVAALDYPFKGDVRVSPEGFRLVLDRFQSSSLSDL